MKILELNNDEILTKVLESDKLREKFEIYIAESEMDYIRDKLRCFNMRCAAWSIGLYNNNYFRCKDASEFVYCAREMYNAFGLSEKTLNALQRAEKLRDYNLFEYYAKKLAESIEADFCDEINAIEKNCHDIYSRNVTDILLDYCEMFAVCYLDDVEIDDSGRLYHVVYL